MATWLNGGDWGTRENAIPGEWALLVLCMVAAALVGVAVFWFTTLRHEQAVLRRARRQADRSEGGTGGAGREPEQQPTQTSGSEPEAEEAEAEPSREHASHFAADPGPTAPKPPADVGTESHHESAPERETEPARRPKSSPAPVFRGRKPVRHKLTQEMLDLVAHERSRRKSVKWKELAALVEREFGVQVHPRALERSLRRRKTPAEAASDSASA